MLKKVMILFLTVVLKPRRMYSEPNDKPPARNITLRVMFADMAWGVLHRLGIFYADIGVASLGRDKGGAGSAQVHPEAAVAAQVQLASREELHPQRVWLDTKYHQRQPASQGN